MGIPTEARISPLARPGFTVKNSSGTRGFLTAGHCGNTQTYYESATISYSSNYQTEIRDADQDVQWHTTPTHSVYAQFYAYSDLRTVTDTEPRSAQAVGDYVCHRGKATGYSCGNIESTNYQPTWTNACPGTTCSSVWIKVSGSSLECYPGDSGGPWFNAYTAYGIYKGQSSTGTTAADCNWAVYMAINYVSGLGVSVLTG